MIRYQCQICKRYFSTHGGLIQHANAKHQGRIPPSLTNNPVQQRSLREVTTLEHNARLWSMPIAMISLQSTSQDYNVEIKDIVFTT